ncbi:MAG: Exodeoxyribonuclease 7 large subunit [uncultured bacterium]|nr:MAG: Exodeoxyribonuclease 7 large subunit [uncultured bacterium]
MGLGDLQLKFLELKEKLFKMGWFDAQRKKPIPYLPERIAIVTSQTGAAIRDMLNIIYTRFPSMNVLVFPVKVQGEGAAQDIAFAINKINELNLASVIITGRGGGSIEDLWAFNEFIVAKAIYESSIPVISAVGHEIDFTISDFVADYRAETPSAAAVKVVPMEEELIQKIENYKFDFKNIIQNKIEYYKDLLQSYKNHYCFKEPANQLKQFYQRLDDLFNLLNKSMQSTLAMKKEEIKKLSLLLTSLSPYNILERGYSISLDSLTNKVIRKINDLHSGQTICTILKDGKFESEVKSISPN